MSVKLLIVSCKAYNLQLTMYTLKFGFELNTKYITSSRNTTEFIVLYYTTTCFDPFFRPS